MLRLMFALLSISLIAFPCRAETLASNLIANAQQGESLSQDQKVLDTTDSQQNANESKDKAEFVAVPFIFSTETLGLTGGGAGVVKHAGQKQAVALGIGLYSDNHSWIGYLGLFNYQIPSFDRWLFSAETYRGHYTQGIYFLNQGETQVVAPTRVIAEGDEGFTRLHVKYVLPIADGKNGAVDYLYQKRPVSSWNPLKSGVTSIELSPFSHFRELDVMQPLPTLAIGTDVLLKWDNRDSANNSTKGGQTSFKWTQGFAVDDVANWSKWEFEQSAFFSLGSNKIFDEQVIASNVFIADTPTWNDYDRSTKDYQRPPSFVGVFLGGFNRSRGYSSKEYTGRSAINYALEYRVKPKWQPLQDWPLFNLYQVPWWQWTVFAEAGQVSDEFNLQSLHQDMLFTVGAGVRFEIEQMVVRADFAKGSEQSQFWVMVNQTF